MPITKKGAKILSAMEKEYGAEKGKAVYFASIVKGGDDRELQVKAADGVQGAKKGLSARRKLTSLVLCKTFTSEVDSKGPERGGSERERDAESASGKDHSCRCRGKM